MFAYPLFRVPKMSILRKVLSTENLSYLLLSEIVYVDSLKTLIPASGGKVLFVFAVVQENQYYDYRRNRYHSDYERNRLIER